MAGTDEPDVRWEGHSHQEIWNWVHSGPGGAGSSHIDPLIDQVASSLNDAGDLVNKAVQKANAGDDWTGSAATSASGAMSTLRDFDDVTQGHSVSSYDSTVGQAGTSSYARGAVPPVIKHGINSVSMTPDGILTNTNNLGAHEAAAQQAQEQARSVMKSYGQQSIDRMSGMPTIASTPKVVFGKGDTAAPGGARPNTPGGHATVPSPGGQTTPAGSGPTGASPSGGPVTSGSTRVPPVGSPAGLTSPSGTPPVTTDPPPVPGRSGLPDDQPPGTTPRGPAPVGGGVPNPGPFGAGPDPRPGAGPNTGANPGTRGIGAGPGADEPGPLGGRGPGQAGGPGEPGEPGASGRGVAEGLGARGSGLAERPVAGRGAAPGFMGGGAGGGRGGRDDDEEHHSRYGLPSEDYFDDDDGEFLRDPVNRDLYVAPEVIE